MANTKYFDFQILKNSCVKFKQSDFENGWVHKQPGNVSSPTQEGLTLYHPDTPLIDDSLSELKQAQNTNE